MEKVEGGVRVWGIDRARCGPPSSFHYHSRRGRLRSTGQARWMRLIGKGRMPCVSVRKGRAVKRVGGMDWSLSSFHHHSCRRLTRWIHAREGRGTGRVRGHTRGLGVGTLKVRGGTGGMGGGTGRVRVVMGRGGCRE